MDNKNKNIAACITAIFLKMKLVILLIIAILFVLLVINQQSSSEGNNITILASRSIYPKSELEKETSVLADQKVNKRQKTVSDELILTSEWREKLKQDAIY